MQAGGKTQRCQDGVHVLPDENTCAQGRLEFIGESHADLPARHPSLANRSLDDAASSTERPAHGMQFGISQGESHRNQSSGRPPAASNRERFLHGDCRPAMMAVIESMKSHKIMSDQVLGRLDVQEGLATILADLVYAGFRQKREEA